MSEARASGAWGNFDVWADRLVRGEVSFDVFARNVKNDVSRMAWAATKRRRPPYWMGIEDVEGLILQHVWYYAFQHKSRDGKIGYDPTRGASAGSFLRWNAAQHVQKDIGKARGENMHAHRLDGPPPETLSKTGESPELRETTDEEERFDDGRKSAAMAKIVEATKNFIVQREVMKTFTAKDAGAAKDRVVSFLMRQPKYVRETLGIKRRADALRFWWMYFNFGFAKDAVQAKRAIEKAVVDALPPVAPMPETRHPKEDAISCEDHRLVEEHVTKPSRQRGYRPNRSDMIVEHGNLRAFRLGCRCPECRGAKRREWVVWETRKQARAKEAALS
jgi:hypothetical protein